MPFSIAYPLETQEIVFDAHDEAFSFFGGFCFNGIYDNISTAADVVLSGKEKRFNTAHLTDVLPPSGDPDCMYPRCELRERAG